MNAFWNMFFDNLHFLIKERMKSMYTGVEK